MTTITNPAGTPTVAYNDSGKTIQSLTAAGTTAGTATQIPHYSECDIVLATVPDNMDTGFMLPTNGDPGDSIEIYYVSGSYNFTLYAPAGTTINGGSSMTGSGARLRRITSTSWLSM